MVLTALGGFIAASGGFWVYLRRRQERRDASVKLLMSLVYDKIVHWGMKYIERGYITKDEFDDLIRYFWEPYEELGGNGTAERIVNLVKRLPLEPQPSRADTMEVAMNKLHAGSEKVIDRIERGDRLERPDH